MKRFVFIALAFVSIFSTAFASREVPSARETAIDLEKIFELNQIGVGYNGGQISGALYSDFGTEDLRFTVNILELGGSMFNNGTIVQNTSMPWVQGLPKFFVGAGYLINDYVRVAVGYGGKLRQSQFGSGWYGNDASLFFQADIDDVNIIKVGVPVQFGMGYGNKDYFGEIEWYGKDPIQGIESEATGSYSFENKNMSAILIAPDIRWETELGILTEIRLAIPFGMSTIKSQTVAKDQLDAADSTFFNEVYTKEIKSKTLGIDLEVFLTFITDPVIFAFVPHVNFKTSLEGNYLETDIFGGDVYRTNAYTGMEKYYIEKPWEARVDLAFEISTESEMVYVWTGPQLRLMAAGGKDIFQNNQSGPFGSYGDARKDIFYGLGYALPIEVTIRPNSNLEINIGMIGEGSPFTGNPGELQVRVDGSVVWYF